MSKFYFITLNRGERSINDVVVCIRRTITVVLSVVSMIAKTSIRTWKKTRQVREE